MSNLDKSSKSKERHFKKFDNFEETETTSKSQFLGLSLLELNISAKKIAQFLGFVVLGLILTSLTGQFIRYFLGHGTLKGLIPLVNVDVESNIPSMYSSFTLLVCCILLAIIAIAKNRENDRYAFHWKCLSLIFLYLSLDEATSIHEIIIRPLRALLNTGGILYFAWIIPGAAFVLIFVLTYLKFVTSLPIKIKRLFIIAGVIYVAGALGIECIGGWYVDLNGKDNMTYAIITTLEETLEMLGIIAFIYALLLYISSYLKSVQISFMDKD